MTLIYIMYTSLLLSYLLIPHYFESCYSNMLYYSNVNDTYNTETIALTNKDSPSDLGTDLNKNGINGK